MDTIAILLTVLVGAAGYAMQAYIAQRAERSSEGAAQELHVHEQEREREHLQVVAQIERTDRLLDGPPSTPLFSRAGLSEKRASDRILWCLHPECCRPIHLEHGAIVNARYSFVGDTVQRMESSHPDAVGVMLAHATSMAVVGPDGTGRSAGSGNVP